MSALTTADTFQSLQLELKYIHKAPKVRQTLGIFGFIRTPLVPFDPGQPHFMMPLLHVDSVGEAIVNSLYSGFGRTIYLPGIMSSVTALVSSMRFSIVWTSLT